MISDVHTGDDVLDWLGTDDAAQQARRLVLRHALAGAQALAEDVLQDARIGVWSAMQRGPLKVDNPGGYGRTAIKNVVLKIVRGRCEELPDDDTLLEPGRSGLSGPGDPVGETVANGPADPSGAVEGLDDLRVAVERTSVPEPWITSAMLSVVTLRAYPDEIDLDGVPSPRAGAAPDQQLVWPALWFAGQRDHFPDDGDDTKDRNRKNKARSRMIGKVLKGCDAAGMRYLVERGPDNG